MVVITGGTSGIGLGMAEALIHAGADVCVWGRNEERNVSAQERLSRLGGNVLALCCDVSDEEQVNRVFAETVTHFGKVDGCIANASAGPQGTSTPDMTTDLWRQGLGNDLDSVFFTLRAASRHMIERGQGGRLVATSTQGSIRGLPSVAYGVAKSGVNALILSLAVQLAPHGITANAILPAWVDTPMAQSMVTNNPDRFHNVIIPCIPMQRWGQPEDFGGIAVYLMSSASAYHTGDLIIIDGGNTARL